MTNYILSRLTRKRSPQLKSCFAFVKASVKNDSAIFLLHKCAIHFNFAICKLAKHIHVWFVFDEDQTDYRPHAARYTPCDHAYPFRVCMTKWTDAACGLHLIFALWVWCTRLHMPGTSLDAHQLSTSSTSQLYWRHDPYRRWTERLSQE